MPKAAPSTMVIFARNSSSPFFLPSNVSAPPAMEPDNPALFPDCNNITAINPTDSRTCSTVSAISKEFPSQTYLCGGLFLNNPPLLYSLSIIL